MLLWPIILSTWFLDIFMNYFDIKNSNLGIGTKHFASVRLHWIHMEECDFFLLQIS